jgi:D-alanyl-D-alanine carboxypeptidase/D-alanyl-D-alanine-endopeptidase (penicillin-binding protein 4)
MTSLAAAQGKAALRRAPQRATPSATADFEHRVREITGRPQFKHSQFGVELLELKSGKAMFSLNGDKLFVPGSTAKLLSEGAALALLGPDYRFRTRVYRTGPLAADGTLEGDLVLVAGGDPNLSARVRPDGTLAYTSYDHAYAGSLPGLAVAGDPLVVLKEIAAKVAESGVKRVRGNLLVDTSLFTAERAEPGTGVMISPVMVNDNVVDVSVFAGAHEGEPTGVVASPLTPYLNVVNKATTAKAGSYAALRFTNEVMNSNGTYMVNLEGSVPAGETALAAYKVKTPRRFARLSFWVALQSVGVEVPVPGVGQQDDSRLLASHYTSDELVAEHISAPLAAEVKVTLKTSQNLHAATMPYLLGAIVGKRPSEALQAGFHLEHELLAKAGLDLNDASLADGEGGPGAAFTPDFMVRYLAFMAKQTYAPQFIDALPVMGRDGTLETLLQKSPAAGHVRAKSGTYVYSNGLNQSLLLLGKGLVGYVETRRGHRLAFAVYVNQVQVADMDQVEQVGELLGEIAGAAYELL